MNKVKFWIPLVKGFALISPITYTIDNMESGDSLALNLASLLTAVFVLAVITILFKLRKKDEASILRHLSLGLGISLMIMPGYPGVKGLPFIIFFIVFVGLTGRAGSKKLANNKKLDVSFFLKPLILSLPALALSYYFASQYIWLMIVATIFIAASQQVRDPRSDKKARLALYSISGLVILIGLISTGVQYACS